MYPHPVKWWTPCDNCEELWCIRHGQHVFECDCPELEEILENPDAMEDLDDEEMFGKDWICGE